jgi:putative FmdB family regulatory protein
MPTYDYKCDACQHQFELYQPITAGPKRKCPQCGRSKLRRLIGPGAAIVFKGSGFYTTDYRSESYKKAAAADKAGGKAADGSAKGSDGSGKVAEGPAKAADGSAGKAADGSGKGKAKSGKAKD